MFPTGANQLRAPRTADLLPLAVAAPLHASEARWSVDRPSCLAFATDGLPVFSSEKEFEPDRSSSQSPAYFASGPEGDLIFPGRLAKEDAPPGPRAQRRAAGRRGLTGPA